MDYENGDKESRKYLKDRKYSYDDDDDYYYRMKQKYKDKDRDRNYRDKDRDYKYKDKERRDREKEFRERDRKDRGDRDRDRDKDRDRSYKCKDRDKRHRSKNRSVSPASNKRDRYSHSRSRSRPRSHSKHRSRSKSRHHSHSRSRSRSRHRSNSRHRSHSRQLPPSSLPRKHYDDKRYDSSYSRSKDLLEPPFAHKGQRKMMILEKLGIDLVIPENMDKQDKTQTGGSQTAADSGQKTVAVSGELAAYCNISAANSKMLMERLNRKKLLWTNKSNEQKTSAADNKDGGTTSGTGKNTMWQSAIFSKDGDSKQTAKFKRLMGIKDDESSGGESKPTTSSAAGGDKDLIKRQEEMFQNMEMQYEVARASTHTHRGIGLGFGIHQYPR